MGTALLLLWGQVSQRAACLGLWVVTVLPLAMWPSCLDSCAKGGVPPHLCTSAWSSSEQENQRVLCLGLWMATLHHIHCQNQCAVLRIQRVFLPLLLPLPTWHWLPRDPRTCSSSWSTTANTCIWASYPEVQEFTHLIPLTLEAVMLSCGPRLGMLRPLLPQQKSEDWPTRHLYHHKSSIEPPLITASKATKEIWCQWCCLPPNKSYGDYTTVHIQNQSKRSYPTNLFDTSSGKSPPLWKQQIQKNRKKWLLHQVHRYQCKKHKKHEKARKYDTAKGTQFHNKRSQ